MIEKQNINQLPKGWTIKRFDDFLDYIQPNPYIVESTEYSDDYKIPVLTAGKSFILGNTNEEKGIFNSLPVIIFDDFTTANKFVNFPFKVKSSAMKILKPKDDEVNIKYVFYYMQTVRITFDTHKRYWISVFSKLPIPSPTLTIQQAIVSKIEELFSELDKGVEQLKTTQQQLKTYRQSVLKSAFEGKLTNENVKDGELPYGWKKVSITELAEKNKHALKAGPFGSSLKKEFYVEKGYKIYGQEQVINDDAFYGDYYINKEKYQELNSCKIKPFDILISLVGTVGKVLLLPENCQLGIINPRLIKISLDKEVYSPKFFKYYFESSFVKSFYKAETRGTTMDVLNLGIIKTIPFPLCSITEQKKIVQEIESRLSVADKMEESINQSLQQAEALRQSILKKAFGGKLIKEKEEYKPRNVYFYQTQTLGYISYYSGKHNIEHGEMTIAKYAYILDKIYDVPTYYTYDRWHLGPYPPDMKKVVNNKEFFNNNNGKLEVSNTEKLFKYNYPNKEKVALAIDDLANIFGAYSKKERSHKTELLATVCKVIEDIQSTDLLLIRQSMKEWKIDLPNSIYKNKAEKFSEEEMKKCIEFIIGNGWDNKLIN